MKNIKANIVAACIVVLSIQPSFIKAQSLAYRTVPADIQNEKKEEWKPAKLDDAGSNARNGVEFYAQSMVCSVKKVVSTEKTTFDPPHHHSVVPDLYVTQQVTLLKLTNTNNYAVKVSYQVSDFSPVLNILVPPSATLEGSCATTDDRLAKLVINLDGKTNEEKQQIKNRIRATITVTKIE